MNTCKHYSELILPTGMKIDHDRALPYFHIVFETPQKRRFHVAEPFICDENGYMDDTEFNRADAYISGVFYAIQYAPNIKE